MKYYRLIVKMAFCIWVGCFLLVFTPLGQSVTGKAIIWGIVMVLAFTVDRPIRWVLKHFGIDGG